VRSVHGENKDAVAGLVSTNYFRTLGINAIRGRLFSTENESATGPIPEAIITEKLWKTKFQSDNGVVGKPIHLNKQVYTVIGVIGQEHAAIRRFFETDVFVPATTSGQLGLAPITARNARRYFMLGRLRSDVSLAQARVKAQLLAKSLQIENPQFWKPSTGQPGTISVVSERCSRVPPQAYAGVVLAFTFMIGMAGVLLLIVCSNIGNLALARALSRQREIAIRLAIGSTRWRVVRQMLIESGLIAAGGFAYAYKGNTIDLMGLNSTLMAHASGIKKGFRNHASFDINTFWKLAPDVVGTFYGGEVVTDPAKFILPENLDNFRIIQFTYMAYKHIYDYPRFIQDYLPALVRNTKNDYYIFAYYHRPFLDTLDKKCFQVILLERNSKPPAID